MKFQMLLLAIAFLAALALVESHIGTTNMRNL